VTLTELRMLYELLMKFMTDRSFHSPDYMYFVEVRRRVADHAMVKEAQPRS
jgi:hypothetical protein